MQAGKLRSRVIIQRAVPTQDAIGQPVKSWVELARVWADVRSVSGVAAIRAGGEVAVIKASIRIRRRTDVAEGMRVVHGATTYEVEAVPPAAAGQDFTDLVCKTVT
ncbi:MAG: phage head closure protein [Proteobacteria bacterium]|nr:phage head closure protein [Pseudomonadota bacterium]